MSCGESAGGDGLEFTGTVNALVEGQGAREYTLGGAGPEEIVPSGSQTPKDGCLRQTARMLCIEGKDYALMPRRSVTRTEQIDSSSLHSLISALVRKEKRGWTQWERVAVAEVTLGLLYRSDVGIPPPPKGSGRRYGPTLLDYVFEILREYVTDAQPAARNKAEAIDSAKSWAKSHPRMLLKSYARFKEDPSSEVFTRWEISRDWLYHLGRLGSLIDEPTFDEVADVLKFSPQEQKSIRRQSKERRLVQLWSENCREKGEFPPQEIIDAYLLSALLRGRYYHDLAIKCGGNYVWHSFRNYVLEPITEISRV